MFFKFHFFFRPRLPALHWVTADPAHQLRIAHKDPLSALPEFDHQWQLLFMGKKALIPNIQYSNVWKAKLELCEKLVLEKYGHLGGKVTAVLKHFSFAKQRFDSTSNPKFAYCVLLLPIALLCAMQAGDERNSPDVRRHAAAALEHMTPKELLRHGVTTDFGMECAQFLHAVFDVDDVDPAQIPQKVKDFAHRMSTLFIDGHILGTVGAGTAGCSETYTATSIVFNQLEDALPIQYGKKVHILSTRALPQETRDVMEGMAQIVELMVKRIRADLTSDAFGLCLQIFDLNTWDRQLSSSSSNSLDTLQKHFSDLSGFMKLGCESLWPQFVLVVKTLLRIWKEASSASAGRNIQNKVAWTWVLDAKWRELYIKKTNFVLNDKLDRLIRFYISLRLGTPAVERGLSALQDCLEKHDGPLSDEVCYNLVLLKLDGPKSEKNICSRDASSQQWIFSDFSRMCQQLYLERYGRRFCSIYSKSKQQMEDNNNIPASKPSRKFKGCKPKLGCCFVININQ